MIFLKLFFFISLCIKVHTFECGGVRDEFEFGPPNHRNLLTRSTTKSAIRLSYQYLNFDMGTTELNTYFKVTLMGAVDNFFTTRLKVNSVQQNIVLSINSCLGFSIPAEHKTSGVADADIIVYLKSERTSGQSYIAYAGSCSLDTSYRNNVVAGLVMVNIPNFIGSTFESHFSTMTHEIYHLLGFSSNLFQYWRKADGSAHSAVTEKVTIRGAAKTVIKTPNVLMKAREAFECETLVGVELEDQGGSGTAGSHWDMRVMFSDFMIGKDHSDPIFTSISLALMQDTGWYDVDYSKADFPLYAKGYKCSFIDEKCIINGKSNFPNVFCDTAADWVCDTWAFRKAKCGISSYGSISAAFQYFSTATKGGDQYADFCPVFQGYSNGNCRAEKSSDTIQQSGTDEVIGPKSRCFISTLSRTSTLSSYSACYEVTSCSETGANVKIASNSIFCPFTGGAQTVAGYKGKIFCPASTVLCQNFPCKDGCAGTGKCVNGVCQCDPGFYGDNCLSRCDATCEDCSGSECLKCKSINASVDGKVCSCKAGFVPDGLGNCLTNTGECGTLCLECNNGLCSKCVENANLSNQACVCPMGYFVKNLQSVSSCQPCPSGCQSCSESACQSCKDLNSVPSGLACSCKIGYALNSSGTCEVLKSCDSLCSSCSNGICSQCTSGAELLNNVCSCRSGYRKGETTCIACSSACSICDSSKCLKCSTGASFSGLECVCDARYMINPANPSICDPCPNDCQSCSKPNSCDVCMKGFHLMGGLCRSCSSGCEICDSSQCSKCMTGFYLKLNLCMKGCTDNCQACSSSGLCSSCQENFYLDSQNKCAACGINCKICKTATLCSQCNSGFELKNDGTCIKACSIGCSDCDFVTYKCSQCSDGYFLDSFSCMSCSANCLNCKSQDNCIKCQTGYHLGFGTCKSECPSNCVKCLSKNWCTQCSDGYSVSIFGSCMVKCPEQCIRCDFKGKCIYCNSGFFVSSGLCKPCLVNCSSCISSSKCIACNSGYYLTINWKCAACPNNCMSCIGSLCITCNSGFKVKNGKCVLK